MNTPLTYYPVLDQGYGNPERTEKLEQLQNYIDTTLTTSGRIAATLEEADMILVGGGDGFMFRAMRKYYQANKPFYGINCGSKGFLLNQLQDNLQLPANKEDLIAIETPLIPIEATRIDGSVESGFFTNDVVVIGHGADGYKFTINVDGQTISTFATGINVNTPLGSTGYAIKLDQQVLPLKSKLLGIVGIGAVPFRNRIVRWQEINIDIDRIRKFTPAAALDGRSHFIEDVRHVRISPPTEFATLAFNKDEPFEEKRALHTENLYTEQDTRNI